MFWPCLVGAASCNILASFPPQLFSVSKTMKIKFLPFILPVGHLRYLLGGRQLKVGTNVSSSLKVSGLMVACCGKSRLNLKTILLS